MSKTPTVPSKMSIKIISWNANSINAHSIELKNYIQNCQIKPDVICVQETFLKSKSKFKIPGYSIESKNRSDDRRWGGVATFIKEGTIYERIQNIPQTLEGVTIKLYTSEGQILITNIYIPSGTTANDYEILRPIFNQQNSIICGDMNAKNRLWGSPKNDAQGIRMIELIDNNYIVLNDGSGTHINNDGSMSHLDLAIVSNSISVKCSWRTLDEDWNSDHVPTEITFNEAAIFEQTSLPKFKFKKADWAEFKQNCKLVINDSLIDPSMDKMNDNITVAIMSIADLCIPRKKNRGKKMLPFWNEDCKQAVENKRKIRKKMLKSKDPAECLEYKRAKAIAQRTFKSSEKQHWKTYCGTINNGTKLNSIWRMIKSMAGTKSKQSIPTIKHENKSFVTNTEKAEAFAASISKNSSDLNFEETFLENRKNLHIDTTPNHELDTHPMNDEFEFHEIKTAISQCKMNSSPGEDGVCYEMLKHLPKQS